MNISSSSLFRFTTKFEYLKQIILEGFEYRECVEDMAIAGYENDPWTGTGVVVTQLHSRSVCFCDLPLSQSKEHRNQYGNYAIAMNKEWAMKQKITPIRYYHSESPDHGDSQTRLMLDLYVEAQQNPGGAIGALLQMLESLGLAPSVEEFTSSPENVKSLIKQVNELLFSCLEHHWKTINLTRVYEGEWTDRSTGDTTIRRFYDEREWRAVSFKAESRLTFKFDDIQHIIVSSEAERKVLGDLILSMGESMNAPDSSAVWGLIKVADKIYGDV